MFIPNFYFYVSTVRELEPQIHPEVIGGWWFPEDASVDARRLTCSLRAACVAAGVQIMMGPETAAESLELSGKFFFLLCSLRMNSFYGLNSLIFFEPIL